MPEQISDIAEFTLLHDERAVYFNGFAVAVTPGDILITLTRNGQANLTLNASYSVTKTFALALSAAVSNFEKSCEHEIMTVNHIKSVMDKSAHTSPAEHGEQ